MSRRKAKRPRSMSALASPIARAMRISGNTVLNTTPHLRGAVNLEPWLQQDAYSLIGLEAQRQRPATPNPHVVNLLSAFNANVSAGKSLANAINLDDAPAVSAPIHNNGKVIRVLDHQDTSLRVSERKTIDLLSDDENILNRGVKRQKLNLSGELQRKPLQQTYPELLERQQRELPDEIEEDESQSEEGVIHLADNVPEVEKEKDMFATSNRKLEAMEVVKQPKWLKTKLKYYQKQGLCWMIKQETENPIRGGILADQMGLGKSLQVLSLIRHNRAIGQGPTLIVCPIATMFQWGDQIEEHFNDTDEDKPSYFFWYQKYRKGKTEEDLRKFDIVIAPYGTLRSDHDKNQVLMYTQWNRVVLDEGHLIQTSSWKVCMELHAPHKWILSGTPIQNCLADMYNQLLFVGARHSSDELTWKREIEEPCESDVKEYRDHKKAQKTEAFRKLHKILDTCLLRRTHSTRLRGKPIVHIPDVHLTTVTYHMQDDERVFYEAFAAATVDTFDRIQARGGKEVGKEILYILELLLRLRQSCNHPYIVILCNREERKDKATWNWKNFMAVVERHFLEKVEFLRSFGTSANTTPRRLLANVQIQTCGLCQTELSKDNLTTPCGHTFCATCIKPFLNKHHSCPECGTGQITEAKLTDTPIIYERFSFSGDIKDGKDETKEVKDDQRPEVEIKSDIKPVVQKNQGGDVVVEESSLRITSADLSNNWNAIYNITDPTSNTKAKSKPTRTSQRSGLTSSLYDDSDHEQDGVNNNDLEIDVDVLEQLESWDEKPKISIDEEEDEADDAFLDYDYGITPSHFRRKLFQEAEMKRRNGRRELLDTSRLKPQFGDYDPNFYMGTKTKTLLYYLKNITEEAPTDKCLIFSSLTMFLNLVEEKIKLTGMKYERLDGTLSPEIRRDKITRFTIDDDVRLFLISTRAGGIGLNLACANRVFLLDPWWNPAVDLQAIERVKRIGQKKEIHVYRLVAKNSIEEHILLLQAQKQALADAALQGDGFGGGKTNPSVKDLKEIFRKIRRQDTPVIQNNHSNRTHKPSLPENRFGLLAPRKIGSQPQPTTQGPKLGGIVSQMRQRIESFSLDDDPPTSVSRTSQTITQTTTNANNISQKNEESKEKVKEERIPFKRKRLPEMNLTGNEPELETPSSRPTRSTRATPTTPTASQEIILMEDESETETQPKRSTRSTTSAASQETNFTEIETQTPSKSEPVKLPNMKRSSSQKRTISVVSDSEKDEEQEAGRRRSKRVRRAPKSMDM